MLYVCCPSSSTGAASSSEWTSQHFTSLLSFSCFSHVGAAAALPHHVPTCNWIRMNQNLPSKPDLLRRKRSLKLGYQRYGTGLFHQQSAPLSGKSSRRRSERCVKVHAEDDTANNSRENADRSVQATVEQTKRILALQKQLLEQITERKKLVTTLKDNLGNSAKQIKAYNESGTSRFDESGQVSSTAGVSESQSSPGQRNISETVESSVKVLQPLKGPPAAAAAAPSATPSTRLQNPGRVSRSESAAFNSQSTASHPEEIVTLSSSTSSSVLSSPLQEVLPGKQIPVVTGRKPVLVVDGIDVEGKDSYLYPEKGVATEKVQEKPPPLAGPNVMNVIFVAAECAPWSKTGGLGDVAGALPKALAHRGHRVMVVAPRYANYAEAWEIPIRKIYNVAGQDMEVGYFHAYIDGVDYVFVNNPIFHGFAKNIYGGSREDILKRMILLCKAAVEIQWHVPCGGVCYGDGNLTFIANDWHTALLPVYLQAYYRDHGMMAYTRAVLVIHNMAHQGRGPLRDFGYLGLPDHYINKFRLYDPVGGEHMNIFMAGLITAHRIIAVSHGYAWECQTQEGGWGLDRVVRENGWKLEGIVNGIDDKEWNPELDIFLHGNGYANYTIGTLETGKAKCKAALQQELGLPVRSNVPVLGFIGRLDHQKGVDIIAEAMHWLMGQDLQLILLGSGRPDLENMLRAFETQYRDKVRGWVGFSVKTAHRITAGADILLMPSRFEPCGLNQLYAMRYGTVPVVHAVGGLRDTVQGFDPYANMGTGWTFDRADPSALIHAVGNALLTYREFKDSWVGIQKRGMTQDLSWDNAAKKYEEVLITAKHQW